MRPETTTSVPLIPALAAMTALQIALNAFIGATLMLAIGRHR